MHKINYTRIFVGIIIGVLSTLGIKYYLYSTGGIKIGLDRKNIKEGNQAVLNKVCSSSNSGAFLDRIYPVGSIYISTTLSSTSAVASALGGTWEEYGEGRALMGVGNNGSTSYNTVDTTGGTESETYTPRGTNSGMAVAFNQITLTHTGGSLGNTTLTQANLPNITGQITMHNILSSDTSANFTGIRAATGILSGTATNSNKASYMGSNSGAPSINKIQLSFGNSESHTHTYTNPNSHTFTPTAKTYTNPTFVGDEATISHMQPYITVYMYKRTN